MEKIDRYLGSLQGLAVGDALGTTLEFAEPGTFTPITDMVGGGPFSLRPGEWTDDTSMALCLAESLVEKNGFDPQDQMERYVRWWKEGHLSHSGNCFDIGNTTRKALSQFEITQDSFSGSSDSFAAGNGSIMRLAPVPMFYAREPELAIMKSAESSRTTHGANEAIDACKYLAAIIAGAINGATKDELLSERYCPIDDYWKNNPLTPSIDEIAMGSFKRKDPPDIKGTGYVVKSLEAALWAFNKGKTFEEGCLLAVNLGADADTTGAVYGQIAGAYFGKQGIPERWLTNLAWRPTILDLAHRLFDSSKKWRPRPDSNWRSQP